MNRENIKKVRDHIESLNDEQFDMRNWPPEAHICQTAMCIGGWAQSLIGNDTSDVDEWLGLTRTQGKDLFLPSSFMSMDYSRPHAVRVLDHLLETGEVDWKSTRRAKKAVAK